MRTRTLCLLSRTAPEGVVTWYFTWMLPDPMALTGTSTVVALLAVTTRLVAGVACSLGSSGIRVTSTWTSHGSELRMRTGKAADLLMRLTASEGSTAMEASSPATCAA